MGRGGLDLKLMRSRSQARQSARGAPPAAPGRQSAQLPGREGGRGMALPPGAGSWGRPWESGCFSGLDGFPRAAEVTRGLSGCA